MNGIFYFSSTGNSFDIARQLSSKIEGDIHYIVKYDGNINIYSQIIIVSPVYSFGLPAPVENFIHNLNTNLPCYIILNYGGMAFSAPYYTYKVCLESRINICGIYKLRMPENFTLYLTQPDYFIKSALKKSKKSISIIANKIINNEKYIPRKPLLNLEKIFLRFKENCKFLAKSFIVSEECTYGDGCRKCVNLCPSNNISALENKIIFDSNCIACLGCYHNCPKKAINYKNITKNKKRYRNPNIDKIF